MSEHREWALQRDNGILFNGIWLGRGGTDCRFVSADFDSAKIATAEHNATVRAYRDAMAELERIGKINDSMCDTIAELEADHKEPLGTYATIRAELEAVKALLDNCERQLSDSRANELDAKTELAALRQRDTVPVKVRFAVEPSDVWCVFRDDGATNGPDSMQVAMDYLAAHAVIDVPAGVPSVEELEDIGHTAFLDATIPYSNASRARTTAILTALRPWLRTPTGWELDVTAKDVYDYWADMEGTETAQGAIDFIKSRIRPTFGPCQECAELRERLARMIDTSATLHTHATEARAALEGK